MTDLKWHRVGALSGFLFVVMQFVGFGIGGASRGFERVTLTSTDATVTEATSEAVPSAVWIGGYVEVLAYLLFVVFAVWLGVALSGYEPAPRWASASVAAAGLLVVATSFIGYASEAAAYYRAGDGIELGVARALLDSGNFAYTLAWGGLAIFLAGAGAVGARTQAFPRWLVVLALALAATFLAALALPETAVGEIADLVFWVWVISVTIALIRRGPAPVAAPVRQAAGPAF
ncbi:MAG: hypothetical protein ACRDK3_02495 [Actinomycetota bacterium]